MSADTDSIDGTGDPASYDVLTGGLYSSLQDPYTAGDDGTLSNGTTGTGTAASPSTASQPANSSTYTPPSWLTSLLGTATTVGQSYTTLAPIINGKPATGPTQAGSAPGTVSLGGISISTTMLAIGGIVLAAVAFMFLRKK